MLKLYYTISKRRITVTKAFNLQNEGSVALQVHSGKSSINCNRRLPGWWSICWRERKKEKERRMQWMKRFISWIQDCYFQWELASMLVVMDPVEKYFFRILLSKCKHHFFKHTSSWMHEMIFNLLILPIGPWKASLNCKILPCYVWN